MATYQAGGDVDAYCNKCKLLLNHVIVALRQTRPARVECRTCKDVHAYRKTAIAPRQKTAKSADKQRVSESSRHASEYDALLQTTSHQQPQTYTTSQTYQKGDLLSHVFGLGIVVRVLADNKIAVVFPDGKKILIHSRVV